MQKAATTLGFQAQIQLEEGLRGLLEWRHQAKAEAAVATVGGTL
jgi:hypothetical protein